VARFDYRNLPNWLIFDHEFLRRYGFGWVATPSDTAPSWMIQAPTLAALAERLGVPGDALADTVARWNQQVAVDNDPDFHRGDSANDRWWGDPAHKGERAATLGPLETGPFYAVEIKSGTLGTKGGPSVDTDARVIDFDGRAIAGLYAAGNVMASPMGMTYGGAGGTLAPGMVFGFLAGGHAAGHAKAGM
jgi:3-oxosteroid 1-dehydrogenase